jgi:hypothetical protein
MPISLSLASILSAIAKDQLTCVVTSFGIAATASLNRFNIYIISSFYNNTNKNSPARGEAGAGERNKLL